MHVLIVDDEALARGRLARLIDGFDGYESVGEAEDGEQALDAVLHSDPDIVLLDIRMPGEDGLAAAKKISELPEPPAIIFCTAYDEYAIQAFETLAVGYLLKPVKEQDLLAALDKASKVNKVQKSSLEAQYGVEDNDANHRQNISAKTRRGLELIPVDDVQCFVADQKYVTVFHAGGETLIDDTLKDLEKEFAKSFVRVHRNALVAIKYIEGLDRVSAGHYELRLKGSEQRPVVSRRHVSGVRDLLSHL